MRQWHGGVRAVPLLVMVTVALAAYGCGGKSSSDTSGDAFAHRPPATIIAAAESEMKGLHAVHYAGQISTGGQPVSLDIQAKDNGDCSGTVGIAGGTATVLASGGKGWFRGDRAFWQGTAGANADNVIKAVGNKWVLDTSQDFTQFCSLSEFFTNLFKQTASTYKTDGITTIGGDRVVKVEGSGGQSKGSAAGYVLLDGGHHYLIRIQRVQGSDTGQLDFDEFDRSFAVHAPAAANVVDPSTL